MASNKNVSEISNQLNLDMDIIFVPQTISDVLTEVSVIHDTSVKSSKFHFHIHLLEEELKKVDAFKRELPYCMQLLQDGLLSLSLLHTHTNARTHTPTYTHPMKSFFIANQITSLMICFIHIFTSLIILLFNSTNFIFVLFSSICTV